MHLRDLARASQLAIHLEEAQRRLAHLAHATEVECSVKREGAPAFVIRMPANHVREALQARCRELKAELRAIGVEPEPGTAADA